MAPTHRLPIKTKVQSLKCGSRYDDLVDPQLRGRKRRKALQRLCDQVQTGKLQAQSQARITQRAQAMALPGLYLYGDKKSWSQRSQSEEKGQSETDHEDPNNYESLASEEENESWEEEFCAEEPGSKAVAVDVDDSAGNSPMTTEVAVQTELSIPWNAILRIIKVLPNGVA